MAKKQTGKTPMKKMAVKSVSISSKMPVKSMKAKSDTIADIPMKRTTFDRAKSAVRGASTIGLIYESLKKNR